MKLSFGPKYPWRNFYGGITPAVIAVSDPNVSGLSFAFMVHALAVISYSSHFISCKRSNVQAVHHPVNCKLFPLLCCVT